MEYISVCIYYFLLGVAAYIFTSHICHKFTNLPPTIFPSIPILGHLYLIKQPLYRTLAKISDKYGPIVLINFGFRRVLLVSSPLAVEECLSKDDVVFANRPQLLFGKIIGNNFSNMPWLPYGQNFRNFRSIFSIKMLSTHHLNESKDIRDDESRSLIRELLLKYSSHPVNMKLVFSELTLNMMMRMLTGKRYFSVENSKEGKEFQELLDETSLLASAANVVDYVPMLRWFGVKGLEKKLIALKKKRDDFIHKLIEEHKKCRGEENKKNTLIEFLLSEQESDPKQYTDEVIGNMVLGLTVASTDTSSGTMEWALSLLLNNPHVLRKAQEEIDKHVGQERFLNESDIANLPYICSIINETLRLYPPLPYLIPHESSKDCVVGGYNIPQGTMLIVNQWAVHHDPHLWNEPERFIPERFQGLEGTRDGFKLMPFGSGRRGCPGEALAIRVMGSTLGLLIQCFDWERLSEKLIDMNEAPGLTMPKAQPLIAKCKPRVQMQNLLSQML